SANAAAGTARAVSVKHAAAPRRATNLSLSRGGRRSLGLPGPVSQAPVVLFSRKRYLMFDLSPVWKLLRGSGKRRATVRKPPRARLVLEALDERIMLSVTSTFSATTGVLTVAGDDQDNTIVVSRDVAGTILVNNGAVAIQGGQATVANTSKIQVTGGAGNDVLTMDETNGGLPQTTLDGGAGNDVLTGGAVAHDPGSFVTLLGNAGD